MVVRVSILYPQQAGARFDMAYYLDRHMPESIRRLEVADGYAGVSVERGIGGGAPDTAAPFVAACHYRFERTEDFIVAFTPHAGFLQGDMANYTDIEPVIQISEIAIERGSRR